MPLAGLEPALFRLEEKRAADAIKDSPLYNVTYGTSLREQTRFLFKPRVSVPLVY